MRGPKPYGNPGRFFTVDPFGIRRSRTTVSEPPPSVGQDRLKLWHICQAILTRNIILFRILLFQPSDESLQFFREAVKYLTRQQRIFHRSFVIQLFGIDIDEDVTKP